MPTSIALEPYNLLTTVSGPDSTPTFVLVHGIGVSHRYFTPLMRELNSSNRVVSLDLPGFGLSQGPKDALDISELAGIMHNFIVQQGLRDVILVGQSMGCQIVAQLLKDHPHSVRGAILISPTTNDRERTARQQAWRLLEDTLHEPPRLNLLVAHDYLRCGIPRYAGTLRYMLADRIEDNLQSVPARVLIIRGGSDKIVPRHWTERLVGAIPHGELTEIPGAPHLVQYTHAAEVARLCLSFAART